MASAEQPISTYYNFDDRKMRWFPFPEFGGFVFAVLDVDEKSNDVDLILKFEPNSKIFRHRHRAHTNTFVVQGEHLIYETDGSGPNEVRPCGSYTSSAAGAAHHEGGGAEGAVVFYNVRGDNDLLFEVLDEDLKVVGELRTQDFKDALMEQQSA